MLKTFIEVTLQVILILSSWYAVLSVDVVDVMLLQNPSKQTTYYSAQGPEEMCLSLEHQNPSKTSEKMGYFNRVTVSLHIL